MSLLPSGATFSGSVSSFGVLSFAIDGGSWWFTARVDDDDDDDGGLAASKDDAEENGHIISVYQTKSVNLPCTMPAA